MKHNAHSRRNIKTNRNMRFSGSKPAAENVIVFSPTACPSSEKKQCAPEALCGSKSDAPADPDYGTPLLTLSDFGIERVADALYRVSITTEDGMTSSLLLHPFSTNAEFDNVETDSRSAGSESSGVSESEVEP